MGVKRYILFSACYFALGMSVVNASELPFEVECALANPDSRRCVYYDGKDEPHKIDLKCNRLGSSDRANCTITSKKFAGLEVSNLIFPKTSSETATPPGASPAASASPVPAPVPVPVPIPVQDTKQFESEKNKDFKNLLNKAVQSANLAIGKINLQNGGLAFPCETPDSLYLERPKPLNPEFDQAWDTYVSQTLSENTLQIGCAPVRRSPPATVARKGVIILYHGFTACPQQFFEESKLLAAEGYEVLMPLLPGHGRIPLKNGKEDNTRLPGMKNYKDYYKFIDFMNSIVSKAPGRHLVAGVSLGGAMSGRAIEQAPKLYDCQLQVSPFYKLINPIGTAISHAVRYLPIKHLLRLDFGPRCRKERELGRGGYCSYSVDHAAAVDAVGQDTLSQVVPTTATTQIIGSEGDEVASVQAMAQAFRQYIGDQTGADSPQTHFCIGGKDIEHEPISRFDSPLQNKNYLPDVVQSIANWAQHCDAIPTHGPSNYDSRYSRCTWLPDDRSNNR